MIITETITINDIQYIKNYSDADYYIQKVGTEEIYSEAVDPIGTDRTYVETTELIETEENPNEATIEDYQEALTKMGVSL